MDDAHTRPRTLNLPERIELARALQRHALGHVRLPGLTIDGPPCLGKQFGCGCPDCCTPPKQAPDAVIQPWDPRPARHAA